MDLELSDLAVIYAALVATAALVLEVRRWAESGPRLFVHLMPWAKMAGGGRVDPATYLHASATNRGFVPTTITHYLLLEYPSIIHRWLHRPSKSAFVVVGGPTPVPHVVAPGTQWSGQATYDAELLAWAKSGRLFAGVIASHRERPYVKKVVIKPDAELG